MKKGLVYGGVAWLISLFLMAFLVPLLFRGGDMEALGQVWLPISFFVVAIPAFVVGYLKERKQN
jgi:hypothetical protein